MTITAVLLILNAALSVYSANNAKQSVIPDEILEPLYEQYRESPQKVEEMYDDWNRMIEEYNKKYFEIIKYGDGEKLPPPEPFFTDNGIPSDVRIWSKLFYDVNRPKDYSESVLNVIDRAEANIVSYDVSAVRKNSFIYRYQLNVIERYSGLKDSVYIGFENTKGWNTYFSSGTSVIMAVAAVIVFGGCLFIYEKKTGFYPVTNSSVKGHGSLAAAKYFAGLVFVILVSLLMLATNLAVIGIYLGYGSLFNGIQAYDMFTFCPYGFSVAEYLAADTLIKILVIALLYSFVQAASTVLPNAIFPYLSGMLFVGVSIGSYAIFRGSRNSFLYQLNPVSLGKTSELFSRYRAVDIFDMCVDMTFVVAVVIFAAAVLFGAVSWLRYSHGIGEKKSGGYLGDVKARLLSRVPMRKRTYGTSLSGYEFFKLYLNRFSVFFIIILLFFSVIISDMQFRNNPTYSDEHYKEYIDKYLYGPVSKEKSDYVREESESIEAVLNKHDKVVDDYVNDRITVDDFIEFMDEYSYAMSRRDAIKKIAEYSKYLDSVSEEKKISCWYLDESGWEKLLFARADIFLLIFIVYCGYRCWGTERGGSDESQHFMSVLCASENGRRKTVSAKLKALIAGTLTGYAASVLIRLLFIAGRYGLNGLSAPLISLRSFAGTTPHITLGGYICLYLCMQAMIYCLIAVAVFRFSMTVKNTGAVFAVFSVILFLPSLLDSVGVGIMRYADVTRLVSYSPIYLTGYRYAVPLVLPLIIAIAADAVRHMENKGAIT